jgi:hypothetical protein
MLKYVKNTKLGNKFEWQTVVTMGVVSPKTYRLNIPNIYSKKHKMLTMM